MKGNIRKKTTDHKSTQLWLKELPALVLTDLVLFPGVVTPILVQRQNSISAVELSISSYDGEVFLVLGKKQESKKTKNKNGNETLNGPTETIVKPYFSVGVVAKIKEASTYSGHILKIVVETLYPARVKKWSYQREYPIVKIETVTLSSTPTNQKEKKRLKALRSIILREFENYIVEGERGPIESVNKAKEINSYEELLYFVCSHLLLSPQEKQSLLENSTVKELMEKVAKILFRENRILSEERGIVDKIVRDYLEEKSEEEKSITLGDSSAFTSSGDSSNFPSDYTSDVEILRRMIKKAKLPRHALEKAKEELKRFEKAPVYSPEESTIREYIEWLCSLPWCKRTKDALDLEKAKRILDKNHYGLEKVKERILDFLAVKILSGNLTKGPILCFVGPPGVGKTSLGKSIASALKRKFVRMSLGGIRDEAEIRGHMRTYVASTPGRIIQNIKKAGVINPVFVLDEVDKIGTDIRGDPESALLEVLDPEQNQFFVDHYLEVEFDLSEVFFIATANYEEAILPPLRDRMEVITIPSYSPNEKFEIAKNHLIPKILGASGLRKNEISFTPECIFTIISKYTEEAGVRELERQISAIVGKVARWVVTKTRSIPIVISEAEVEEILGPPIYDRLSVTKNLPIGTVIGLAWTPTGGTIQLIETTIMKGKGNLICTGHLGAIMKESAQTALSYIRANAEEFKIDPNFYRNIDIHIHAPEASIHKDGPSAGIAITISLLSTLLKKPQKDGVAMTGEISLTGRVLKVGGIREKVLSAIRSGIKRVILPKENEKDVNEIPQELRNAIDFTFVENIKQVVDIVF
ncbi:MAG: endopeptidase La [Candidatus Hydrogenedentes bacterium]|nr:endopeptidase La [Candidatus Hydrogenedentota bacterium]